MLKKIVCAVFSCTISSLTFSGSMSSFNDYNIEGVYLGLGTGLINLYTNDNFIARKSNSSVSVKETERASYTSILFNGNIGYGKMYSDSYYFGAKASVFYTPFNYVENDSYVVPNGATTTFGENTYTTQIRPFYNIDAVLGYEFIPHFIPFVEGGLTFANVTKKYELSRTVSNYVTNSSTDYSFTVNANNYSTGYNVGIGLNYQARRHWIFAGELLYIDLGQNFGASGAQIPNTAVVDSQSRRLNSSAVALFATISYLL